MRVLIAESFVVLMLSMQLMLHAAVCGFQSEAGQDRVILSPGYDTRGYFTDSILNQRWIVAVDCRHPERPASLILDPGNADRVAAKVSLPEVISGMHVRLWSAGNEAAIQFIGVALATARMGETVRVRTGLRDVVLTGVVRGPGSVELVTPGRWGQP